MRGRALQRNNRIRQDSEIGPAAGSVDGVAAFRMTSVKVRCGRGGEVPAGGKPPNSNTIGADSVVLRLGPYGSDGSLDVQHGCRVQRRWPFGSNDPISQDEGGDAAFIEPGGDLLAFMVVGQMAVAAARTDDDGRADRLFRCRQVGREGRLIRRWMADGGWGDRRPQRFRRRIGGSGNHAKRE
jgi:hypothetical protein